MSGLPGLAAVPPAPQTGQIALLDPDSQDLVLAQRR
jgi:hypothetical protein